MANAHVSDGVRGERRDVVLGRLEYIYIEFVSYPPIRQVAEATAALPPDRSRAGSPPQCATHMLAARLSGLRDPPRRLVRAVRMRPSVAWSAPRQAVLDSEFPALGASRTARTVAATLVDASGDGEAPEGGAVRAHRQTTRDRGRRSHRASPSGEPWRSGDTGLLYLGEAPATPSPADSSRPCGKDPPDRGDRVT